MARRIDKLSKTLARILKARGLEGRLHEYRIFGLWGRAVGPAIARHAQPRALRGRKLALIVDSPAWMQQLSLMKPELIEKLNRELGAETIGDLTMRLGEVVPSDRPEADEGPAAELSTDERETIEQYVHDIADSETREAMKRVIEKDFITRKKRQRRP
jgi:predicted nucleic acid-binding Zn ribbon protein